MKTVLFLDDERNPEDVYWIKYPDIVNYRIVRSYKEAAKFIEDNGLPEYISFDNDLGTKLEGYDFAKYLVEYCLDNKKEYPISFIHTQNNVARDRIVSLINNFNENVNPIS
jgi:hypothetical protein